MGPRGAGRCPICAATRRTSDSADAIGQVGCGDKDSVEATAELNEGCVVDVYELEGDELASQSGPGAGSARVTPAPPGTQGVQSPPNEPLQLTLATPVAHAVHTLHPVASVSFWYWPRGHSWHF